MASRTWHPCRYQIMSFAYDWFPPDCPVRLPPPPPHPPTQLTLPHPSLPPNVYCSKSHGANWDRAAKWSRRDKVPLQCKLDSVPTLVSISSASTSAPQYSNIPSAHTSCDPAVRDWAVGAWLKDEVNSQNWLGRRRAVRIRQWSVAF